MVILWTGSVCVNREVTSAWPVSWYATMRFSSSDITRFFFSSPAIMTSIASSSSCWLTRTFPARTARSAASFMIFSKSAPEAPGVARATTSKSTSGSISTFLACTFRISTRPFWSGRSTIILRSKRPGRKSALSSTSGLFVAARITTPFEESKPSISASNWLSVCSRSSLEPRPLSRLLPMASISSIKTIQGAFSTACLNKSLTREAPTPTNISTNSEPESEKNGTFASPATAFARSVLPVPGGPTKRAPFGSFAPIAVYFPGLFRKSMISTRFCFASSWPATSVNVFPVDFSA